ncbi:hypothetical protein LS482_01565 [Sinomicrobium kalidii]|uniref:hypothetical protein n=1 Tax=Sinomicrobium kalidii TaxID=2900738 RepID=UPI001E4F9325|nr:hypothetical protein [Sinomicrobium kalidii]UGU16569.1 hypothetical protein LS482_01565 [Sinomicrobium kalidii]
MIKTETKHAFFSLVVTTVLIFVGCKEKYLPAVDPATVEEIGPYAITRTENLTGLSLTLPFHYYIEDGGEYAVWAPDLVKERSHYDPYHAKGRAKIKTYVFRSYINDSIGHSRSLYVFKNKDSTAISVEALFEDKSPAVFEEERSAGYYVIYKDKASIVYRSRIGMCYDLHHLYSKKDSTHIVLSDYGTHYGYPFNIDKKGDTIRQIGGMHTTGMHNLKLAKGLLSKKEAEQSLVLDWDLYEKEVRPDYLPDYLKPYTDAVPQIKQTIDSFGHSRSLYVFKNKDSTAISVEALFEDKSPAVFEEERSAGYYVIYKDKASIVYRSRIGMCYDLHHLYSKKDSTHIVLSDYGTHYGYPFNIDKKGDTIRQIGGMHTTGMHNLKLAKGLLSKKEAEQSLVLDWDLYEKEVRPDYLPDYLKPYTDAVPQIKQTIDSLPPGSVVERSFPETAYIGMVKLKEENKLSAIFTTKTTGEQLAALLKRIDARSYELTENRSHTVNVHFKDSTNLLLSVESPPYYSEPDNIYISVTRTTVNKHRMLLYSRTETREMGAFYLSFFKTI